MALLLRRRNFQSRYYYHFSLLSFSTLSESFVLNQLSDLLSISPPNPRPRPFTDQNPPDLVKSACDRRISPADKLRGVFLFKPAGKFAINSALSDACVDLTVQIFADVINHGNLSGEMMVSFFDWAVLQPSVVRSVEIYNLLLKALGRRKFFVFMEEILSRMVNDGFKPSLETVEILVDSYVAARQVIKAVEVFKRLEEIRGDCDTQSLRIVLRSLCRRSHVGVANSLFNSMKRRMDLSFDTELYNEIIEGWAKYGKVDKVDSVWSEMVADGFYPDSLTYAYLIQSLGRAGRISDSVVVFNNMEEKGCQPNTTTYNALIFNFISIGDLDECMRYYKLMLENSCPPNVETYNRMISSFLKVRRVADALEMFDDMLARGIVPTTGMVTSFLEPLCSFGPPYAAMEFYKKARKVGCRLSSKAYKLLLMRLSRFGKCGMVLKLWEEMQNMGHTSDKEVYEYIVNGLCNIGQVDNAVLVVEESLKKGFCLGKIVFSKLNNKLLEMNKVETAYNLFLKVKETRRHSNARSFWRSKGWHF